MTVWVLVVLLYSPGGDLISKNAYGYDNVAQCLEQARKENTTQHPMKIKARAVCKRVTV
jgi:uncharacterized membrane protein